MCLECEQRSFVGIWWRLPMLTTHSKMKYEKNVGSMALLIRCKLLRILNEKSSCICRWSSVKNATATARKTSTWRSSSSSTQIWRQTGDRKRSMADTSPADSYKPSLTTRTCSFMETLPRDALLITLRVFVFGLSTATLMLYAYDTVFLSERFASENRLKCFVGDFAQKTLD